MVRTKPIGTRAFWRDGRSASRRQNSRSRSRTRRLPKASESSGSPAPQGEDVTPEFDLSSLPKLEELTGSTDITAFLRKGVPEHLRNAALRKSWALDPAIRNYVNPALEYAYDWNTPGGVPGGGELGAGVDVARLVSQIMGEPAAETTNSDANSEDEAARSPVSSRPNAICRQNRRKICRCSLSDGRMNRRRKRKPFQRPTAMPANPRRSTNLSRRVLLRRSSRCDVMAPQNRLFRQKFLRT